jgi:hypothetical protein
LLHAASLPVRPIRRRGARRPAALVGVSAPDYAPQEIAETAARLRQAAGLPDAPTGVMGERADRRK